MIPKIGLCPASPFCAASVPERRIFNRNAPGPMRSAAVARIFNVRLFPDSFLNPFSVE